MRHWYLPVIACVLALLLGATYELTRDRITTQQEQYLLSMLEELTGERLAEIEEHEQKLATRHSIFVKTYLARSESGISLGIHQLKTAKGYNGPIEFLAGITEEGEISGIRILSHRETPGLGDAIESRRSTWSDQFIGQSLSRIPLSSWAAKKDNGHFDAVTGATITSRAVIRSLADVLTHDPVLQHR